MESPTNLMTITGFMTFSGRLDQSRLKALIEDKLMAYDRFRMRVVESRLPFKKPYWLEDDDFALRHHFRRVALPEPADLATFQTLVSQLMSTSMDFSKPLWEVHYVENHPGGSAVIVRIHHCIADGLALIQVLLGLADSVPDGVAPPHVGRKTGKPRNTPRGVGGRLLHEGIEVLNNPARLIELARAGGSAAAALGRLVSLPADPPSVFKGTLGSQKRVAWSSSISLDEVKAAGKCQGATINDLLLAAVAGALRSYWRDRLPNDDVQDIRAVVPANLREEGELRSLGNKFGLVFLSLPLSIPEPLERLQELKKRMDAIKGSPEAIVAFGILGAMGLTTQQVQDIGVEIFAQKATGVMTNVPGPRQPLYMCGEKIDSFMFWVPQSGRLGLGVSILSYVGKIQVGIAADARLIPDPNNLVEAYHDSLDELMAACSG
jgi:WS/DGAT/MGAT family acyltransferase